jgi:Na+-transporting NADH:ubiquinone oxidoreductase subunit NqrB
LAETTDSKEEKRRRRRASWAYIIGVFAVVLIWRAIWDWSETYFSSTGSFIIGIILIGIVAFLQRDHVKDLF